MQWLRMIPSEEARRTRRGIRRYFELQGEPIELSDVSDDEDDELEEDDEEEDQEEYMDEVGRRGGVIDIRELED